MKVWVAVIGSELQESFVLAVYIAKEPGQSAITRCLSNRGVKWDGSPIEDDHEGQMRVAYMNDQGDEVASLTEYEIYSHG